MRLVLSLLLLAVLAVPVQAKDPTCRTTAECGRKNLSRYRVSKPTSKPLVCVRFVKNPGAYAVMLTTWVGDKTVISDQKTIVDTEGKFCWPRTSWFRFGTPDKLRLCAIREGDKQGELSQASVELHGEDEVAKPTSPSGVSTPWRACLRGIAGCGGVDHVLLSVQ